MQTATGICRGARGRSGLLCLAAAAIGMLAVSPAVADAPVVISQIYGAGGNAAATFNRDYVELFNRSAATVNIGGWSVQYAASTGSNWQKVNIPAGMTIAPGQYRLVQMTLTGTTGAALPAPDVTATTAVDMSATTGKVALVCNTNFLPVSNPSATDVQIDAQGQAACDWFGSSITKAGIVDFVGYGATANCNEGGTNAPALANSTLAETRNGAGCVDTDVNGSDFTALAAAPRNGATALAPCGAVARGACCSGATCSLQTAADCAAAGRIYDGDYSFCNPNFYTLAIDNSTGIVNDISVTGLLPAPLVGTLDDGSYSGIPIGFTFNYYGVAKTTTNIVTNGHITFGAPSTAVYGGPLPSSLVPNDVIAPYWADLQTTATNVRYQTIGLAGSQLFIVQWTGVTYFTPAGSSLTFQVVLREADGCIEFHYGTMNAGTSLSRRTVGIENSTGLRGELIPSDSILPGTRTRTYCPSTQCPTTGNCCIGTLCVVTTADACCAQAGSYGGDFSSCTPDPCALGACCLPAGGCTDLNLGACTSAGGIYRGAGTTCATANPPCAPGGSCCSATGVCTVTTQANCTASGSLWTLAGTCGAGACPTGACCLPGNICVTLTATGCQAQGGVYRGDGVLCSNPYPNPATWPAGFTDISTTGNQLTLGDDGVSAALPISFPFVYYGVVKNQAFINNNGIVAFVSPLAGNFTNSAIPSAATPNDALYPLWDDLHQTTNSDASVGLVTWQEVGSAPNRIWIAQWTNVGQYNSGAAPLDRNTFQVKLFETSNCIEFHYVFLGAPNADGSTPETTVGIENSTGTSATIAASPRPAVTGPVDIRYVFCPPVNPCDPPLPTGACCHSIPPPVACDVLTQAGCQQVCGIWQGPGTTCNPNPCVPGACCLPQGGCVEILHAACDSASGVYRGDNTLCATVNPPCPPSGRCCSRTGACTNVTQAACEAVVGSVWTAGLTCTTPCLTGACCLNTGVCVIRTEVGCGLEAAGSVYLGDGSTCTPTPCLTGACCQGCVCAIRTADGCIAEGGDYGSDGSTCTPNPCPPCGSCCACDGTCTFVLQSACTGVWTANAPCTGGYPTVFTDIPIAFDDISTTGGTLVGGGDDSIYTGAMPFPFNFYGVAQPTINLVTNGFANFGTTSGAYLDAAIPSAADPNNAIYPLWDDLYLFGNADLTTGELWVKVAGAAGSQVMTVEWKNAGQYASGAAPTEHSTFEMKLFEGSDCIEFHYLSVSAESPAGVSLESTPATSTIGIENSTGTSAVSHASVRPTTNTALRICPLGACPAAQACCFPDGHCTVLSPACCQNQGGITNPAASCTPNPCPQPTGACCTANGCAVGFSAANCAAASGFYYGNGSICPNCDDNNPCTIDGCNPLTGACTHTQICGACCVGNVCTPGQTLGQCQAAGGVFQGVGSGCVPNPCNPCSGYLLGDSNCDGRINNFDIDPFVQGVLFPTAVVKPVQYSPSQDCWDHRACWGDLDHGVNGGVGVINNFDIDPFVACIIGPALPPGTPCP